MKSLIRLPLALCLMLAASLTLAESQIDKLMQLSGINHQLEAIPSSLDAGLNQASGGEGMQEVSAIMHEHFAPEKLKKSTRKSLDKNLSGGDVKKVLEWLESPLGRKITNMEVAASSGDPKKMQAAMPELMNDEKRVALVKKLDDAVLATESSVSMSMGMQKAMLAGVISKSPQGMDQLDQMVESMRPQIEAQYDKYIIPSMVYTYRSLSHKELERYIDFAKTGAGQRYHKAVFSAMSEAVNKASEAVGRSLSES